MAPPSVGPMQGLHTAPSRMPPTNCPVRPSRSVVSVRALDVLAVGAERLGQQVVARRRQLAADQPLGAVLRELDLVLGVPARVVGDDEDNR